MRRAIAAQAFHAAEAKTLLRLAMHARSRTIRNPQVGQSVYYFRRGKGAKKPSYYGPAKVIAVEPPNGDTLTSSVIRLSHAATLIRAAPEHLRAATPLETQVHDIMIHGDQQAPSIVPREARKAKGRHYMELGQPPTDQERLDADEDIPEPPPQRARAVPHQQRTNFEGSGLKTPTYSPSSTPKMEIHP